VRTQVCTHQRLWSEAVGCWDRVSRVLSASGSHPWLRGRPRQRPQLRRQSSFSTRRVRPPAHHCVRERPTALDAHTKGGAVGCSWNWGVHPRVDGGTSHNRPMWESSTQTIEQADKRDVASRQKWKTTTPKMAVNAPILACRQRMVTRQRLFRAPCRIYTVGVLCMHAMPSARATKIGTVPQRGGPEVPGTHLDAA
jgi:hypothetical protein